MINIETLDLVQIKNVNIVSNTIEMRNGEVLKGHFYSSELDRRFRIILRDVGSTEILPYYDFKGYITELEKFTVILYKKKRRKLIL